MEPKKWTAAQIKALRESVRMTQADFGTLIERSRGTIAAWETGAKHPDLASLRALDAAEATAKAAAAADAGVEP